MAFTAHVHFSGAGICEIVRDNKSGSITEAYSLFPNTRKPGVAPHTSRLSFAARHLLNRNIHRIEHQILPGRDGESLFSIDLVDATTIASGNPRSVRILPDGASAPISERKTGDAAALDRIWDLHNSDPFVLRRRDDGNAVSVVVRIEGGELKSEDKITGRWEFKGKPIDPPNNDRLVAQIACQEFLEIEIDRLPRIQIHRPAESAQADIHVSFTHFPLRAFPDEEPHYHVLDLLNSAMTPGHAHGHHASTDRWPVNRDPAATPPTLRCPYGRYEH
ncbi:MAG: hypothetical protein DWQ36_14435 [Acidobacteria bacterium]|nr:MAG: hypothetical protein DWQ30_03170 [Acidobacteriota bacterium]REK06090.1 MAG: hypothetical protein DWQ36_14435 [Acidobacteriota bacterium]